eukprot:3702690-Pyramimonas_sp.AAC.1
MGLAKPCQALLRPASSALLGRPCSVLLSAATPCYGLLGVVRGKALRSLVKPCEALLSSGPSEVRG